MKRFQIYIQEELDEALAAEAARSKTSKAALIREIVGQQLNLGPARPDPLDELVGSVDIDVAPGSVDDVVYGR